MPSKSARGAAAEPPRLATRDERSEAGRALREVIPRELHVDIGGSAGRDPLAILRAQDAGRVPGLVPIRWGRMSTSPLAFYRGAAALMASDLSVTARTDLTVQLCGDAHLLNFGVFAAPDRRLVFDLNDFDETAPGPFEWDIKRLSASIVVAGRNLGFSDKQCGRAAAAAVQRYRTALDTASRFDPLDVWYYRIELDRLDELGPRAGLKGSAKRVVAVEVAAAHKNRLGALAKLTEVVDGHRRIRDRPPLIRRFETDELESEAPRVLAFFDRYTDSLPTDRRHLIRRYRLTDLSLKVVGVGSVGTRCLMALFESGDNEPLFLQIKEAGPSVLERFLGHRVAGQHGRRVVEGQQLVQSAVDVFLGWSHYDGAVGSADYYVRQLWDGKASASIDDMSPKVLTSYAELCGGVLARAHARSGDAAAISGYIGSDDTFDRAITSFAVAYARRNEKDHAAIVAAIAAGELVAMRDI
jgi:uncharacterized protein (DUF2252 family)